MKLSEFQYELPPELIAQRPLKERDAVRLLVVQRGTGGIEEKVFRDIIVYLMEGDCLVLNDTRVLPVRLLGKRKTGGKVEIFLLDPFSEHPSALIRPSARVKEGEVIVLENAAEIEVLGEAFPGRNVRFISTIDKIMEKGHVPLPPYIDRPDDAGDITDYQTVYARKSGATASPTAGLHFTRGLLTELERKGITVAYVTLHTSYGTFAPVSSCDIENHVMHSEAFEITNDAAETINKAKSSGGRIIAVGTTSARVLETAAVSRGVVSPRCGKTNLFIYPGYSFKMIDGLITNFHLPGSTLLMLVSAFAGKDLIFRAYGAAIEKRFRFFSYGDAMLIL